jgi:hypothetical protein
MANDTEHAVRERAKRLGYRLRRRGNDYRLIDAAGGAELGGQDINSMIWWLDVIEYKLPVQFSTACGIPLWKMNAGETCSCMKSSQKPATARGRRRRRRA